MAVTTWVEGLKFPEGPVLMPDGSVLLSELLGNRVVQIWEDGTKKVIAQPAGMPNGLAFGPDGFLYCANMGGLLEPEKVTWLQGADTSITLTFHAVQSANQPIGSCRAGRQCNTITWG